MLLTGWPSISIPILLGDHHMTLSLSWKFNAALSQLSLRKIQITGFTISPFPGSYEKNNLVDELCFWLVIFLNQVIIWSQPDRLNHTKSDCSLSQGCSHWAMPPSPLPTWISEPNKVQQFQFQIPEILLYTSAQKLYGSEISRFLPSMLQFLGNLRQLFIFSNYLREMTLNAGPTKKFFIADHPKTIMNELEG